MPQRHDGLGMRVMTTSDVRERLARVIYNRGRLVYRDQAYEIADTIITEFDVAEKVDMDALCKCGHARRWHFGRVRLRCTYGYGAYHDDCEMFEPAQTKDEAACSNDKS